MQWAVRVAQYSGSGSVQGAGGVSVGLAVVGAREGEDVGDALGDDVGASVGDDDGDAVG